MSDLERLPMHRAHGRGRIGPVAVIAICICAAVLAACTEDDSSPLNVVPIEPDSVVITRGAFPQIATVNSPVPATPGIKVLDEYGSPVPGATVEFRVTRGGGSVSTGRGTTSDVGEITTVWTVGKTVGENELVAEVEGLEPLTFTATSEPDLPAIIQKLTGDAQADTVARELDDSLGVLITDQYGNPTPGVEVYWRLLDGGGQLAFARARTDDQGRATARWILGSIAGTQAVEVAVRGDEVLIRETFTSIAEPDEPAQLVLVDGYGQVASPGEELPEPLVVRVVDQYWNGVPGIEVTWSVETGDGSLASTRTVTDDDGRVEMRYTAGTAPQSEWVRAFADATGNYVDFHFHAR